MNINRYIKVVVGLMAMGSTLIWTACSDTWDDHYENVALNHNGMTLWETINADEQLAPFAKVLKATGYDIHLSSPQMLTVWAPVISDETANELIESYKKEKSEGIKDNDNSVIIQFVKNHIALYNISVSSYTNDTIQMQNGKYQWLKEGSLEGQEFLNRNIATSNGILYKVGQQLPFFPNLWERIQQVKGLDSVAAFFKSFNEYILNESASVPGGVVDGMTVYLDSVTVFNNNFFNNFGHINREDSSYIFLAPTNKVWDELLVKYKRYFQYATNISQATRDSLQNMYAKSAISQSLFFNRNLQGNENDSLINTCYSRFMPYENVFYYPFQENGILQGLEAQQCSNGLLYITDENRIDAKRTFLTESAINATNSRNYEIEKDAKQQSTMICSVVSANDTANVDGIKYNFSIADKNYLQVKAVDNSKNTKITYTKTNTFSNVFYNIYVVMVPEIAFNEKALAEDKLPCRFQVRLLQSKENGTMEEYKSVRPLTVPAGEQGANSRYFITTPNKVDTICLATAINPIVASYGLEQGNIQLVIESNVSSSDNRKKYTRTLRIDEIIFTPFDTKEEAEENIHKFNRNKE